MRRARSLILTLAVGLVVGLASCAAMSPAPPHRPSPRGVRPPAAIRGIQGCPFGIEARLSPTASTAAPGEAMRVPSTGERGQGLRVAIIDPGGARRVVDLDKVFPISMSPNKPSLAESGGVTGVAAQVYITAQNGEIGWTTLDATGAPAPMVTLDPSPLLDDEPVIAPASGGRFAIIWGRGRYPSASDIEFGLIEGGRATHRRTLVEGADAEGMALVPTGRGHVVVYTPSSAGPGAAQGLFAISLDDEGEIIKKTTLLRDEAIWPAATWDGEGVGVAFRWGRKRLGFARLSPAGEVLTPPVVIEEDPDPLASIHPLAIRFHQGLYWVESRVGFHGSVFQARSSESRLIAFDKAGHATSSLDPSEVIRGDVLPVIDAAGSGLRGAYLPEGQGISSFRAFEIACRAAPPDASSASPAGPCDPLTRPLEKGESSPLRDAVALVSAGVPGDLAIATFVAEDPDGAKHHLGVARVGRDGTVRWQAKVTEAGGYSPAIASTGDEIAVAYADGQDLILRIFDAATGAAKPTQIARKGARDHCLAADRGGYLLAYQGRWGSRAVRLLRSGEEESSAGLSLAWTSCALTRTKQGYLLAYTHPGMMTETNYLYVQALDLDGETVGPEIPIERGFARSPALLAAGVGATLVWSGPFGRDIGAIDLDRDGQPAGPARTVAESYGFGGFGLIPDGGRARLVHASDDAYGERRLCAP